MNEDRILRWIYGLDAPSASEKRHFNVHLWRNDYGHNSLHMAVLANNATIVHELIDLHVPLCGRDETGCTPLMMAFLFIDEGCRHDVLKELYLRGGAACEVPSGVLPPLHSAVYCNTGECVSILGGRRELETVDFRGDTALHYCCIYGTELSTKRLLECGANTNAFSANGLLPIHCACSDDDNVGKLIMLVESGCNPEVADKCGRTPLFFAVQSKSLGIVKMLMEFGVSTHDFVPHGFDFSMYELARVVGFPLELLKGNRGSIS